MKLLVLGLICSACFALQVTSYSASPTQAALQYSCATAAKIEVSENASFTPLVHDVDSALFTGANYDSRPGSVSAGSTKLVVVGKRTIELSTVDGVTNVSRALHQGTLHYYRVTCGIQIVIGTFTTKTLPYGATYQDLIPTKADGTYNFPTTSDTDRTQTLIDPQTGVMMKRVSVLPDSNGAPHNPPWPSAGGFGEYCSDVLSPQGNYHCLINEPGEYYSYFYAISPTTGQAQFLGMAMGDYVPLGGGGQFGVGGEEVASFDPTNANVVYKGVVIGSRSTIVKWTYTGGDDPTTAAGGPPAIAPHTQVDLMGGGDLNALAQAYNPAFDPTKFSCGVPGLQGNYALLRCLRYQQGSIAWEGAYNLGNKLPLGGGGTGAIAALSQLWANSGSRWCTDHTSEFLGLSNQIASIAVDYMDAPLFPVWQANNTYGASSEIVDPNGHVQLATTPGVSGASIPTAWSTSGGTTTDGTVVWTDQGLTYQGYGPYNVVLQTPMQAGVAPNTLQTINVTSSWDTRDWGPAPAAWTAGEPVSGNLEHFLQTIQTGDMLNLAGEFMMVQDKISPTQWVVQRAMSESVALTHNPSDQFTVWCQNINSLNTSSGGYVLWDFVSSPHGNEHSGDWVLDWGSHPVSRGTTRSEYQFDPIGLVKSQWGTPPPYQVPTDSVFSGLTAAGSGNSYQKHPSMASGNTYSFFDVTSFVGGNTFAASNTSATTLVAGTSNVWKYDPTGGAGYHPIDVKILPVLAKTVGQSLVDVSAPARVLTDSDNAVWCKPNADGECAAGSRASDPYVYFSLRACNAYPDPTNAPCMQMQGNYGRWCSGGEDGTGINDICIGNWAALGVGAMQFKFVTPSDTTGGETYRPLSRLFSNYELTGINLKLTYLGEWALFWNVTALYPASQYDAAQVWAIEVPPDPGSDGIDRSNFVPATLSLTPPAGMGAVQAQVKFWYPEYGGSESTPYCTSRREGCVAVSSNVNPSNPFYYANTEVYQPTECSQSCLITLPVLPLHTAYYSAEFLDSGGSVVAKSVGLAMENTVAGLDSAVGTVAQGATKIQGGTIRGIVK